MACINACWYYFTDNTKKPKITQETNPQQMFIKYQCNANLNFISGNVVVVTIIQQLTLCPSLLSQRNIGGKILPFIQNVPQKYFVLLLPYRLRISVTITQSAASLHRQGTAAVPLLYYTPFSLYLNTSNNHCFAIIANCTYSFITILTPCLLCQPRCYSRTGV